MKTTYVYSKEQGCIVEKFKAPVIHWLKPLNIKSDEDFKKALDKNIACARGFDNMNINSSYCRTYKAQSDLESDAC